MARAEARTLRAYGVGDDVRLDRRMTESDLATDLHVGDALLADEAVDESLLDAKAARSVLLVDERIGVEELPLVGCLTGGYSWCRSGAIGSGRVRSRPNTNRVSEFVVGVRAEALLAQPSATVDYPDPPRDRDHDPSANSDRQQRAVAHGFVRHRARDAEHARRFSNRHGRRSFGSEGGLFDEVIRQPLVRGRWAWVKFQLFDPFRHTREFATHTRDATREISGPSKLAGRDGRIGGSGATSLCVCPIIRIGGNLSTGETRAEGPLVAPPATRRSRINVERPQRSEDERP